MRRLNMRNPRATSALPLALALFLPLMLTACQMWTSEESGSAAAGGVKYSVKAPEPDRHDVAIISTACDPAPDKDDVIVTSAEALTLTVAVDNRGNQTERNLSLTAKLMGANSAGEGQEQPVETRYQSIDLLAPGEARIVKFAAFNFSDMTTNATTDYLIEVEVGTVIGEVNLGDNTRTIRVSKRPR